MVNIIVKYKWYIIIVVLFLILFVPWRMVFGIVPIQQNEPLPGTPVVPPTPAEIKAYQSKTVAIALSNSMFGSLLSSSPSDISSDNPYGVTPVTSTPTPAINMTPNNSLLYPSLP